MQVAIEHILADRGFGAYTAHSTRSARTAGSAGRWPPRPADGQGLRVRRGATLRSPASVYHTLIGDAFHRDARDGLSFRLDPAEPWGRQLEDRPRRPAGELIKRPLGTASWPTRRRSCSSTSPVARRPLVS
jgi:hypothetical protein